MKTLTLLLPTGILFAWSAPWACQTYSLADGGTTNVNPTLDAGTGGAFSTVGGGPVVYSAASPSFAGLMAGPDGGITVGSSAAFSTNFVYVANHGEGTVSRILIPTAGAPYEEARYPSLVPINNHFHVYNAALGQGSLWQSAGKDNAGNSYPVVDQLDYTQAGKLWQAPSRSVVDRNGNAWVTLRASNWTIDWQAGSTKIVNVDDNALNPNPHLGCVPRCQHRQGLVAGPNGTMLTEGLPLPLAAGGTVTLSPGNVTGPAGTHGGVIWPGSSAAQQYVCQDGAHDYTDENDPTNYDDCVRYSIALGAPQPDLEADPLQITAATGSRLGRGTTIAPNCDPTNTTHECDLWVSLYDPYPNGSLVHLSFDGTGSANPTPAPFDVAVVHHPKFSGYGAVVDCAGVLWTTEGGPADITATTTVPINDFITLPSGALYAIHIPADTTVTDVLTASGQQQGITNTLGCGAYGISTDAKESVWFGSDGSKNKICAFDATQLLQTYPLWANSVGVGATPISAANLAAMNTTLQKAWRQYDVSAYQSVALGRGIVSDKFNNIYMGVDYATTGVGVLSFNPYTTTVTNPVPCLSLSGSCSPAQFNWAGQDMTGAAGSTSVGVDLDANGNLWVNNSTAIGGAFPNAGRSTAVQFDGTTGAEMATVPVGTDAYSYSDFTGYTLRYVTLLRTPYAEQFQGCGTTPEWTQWNTVSFEASVPLGTDIAFAVNVSDNTSSPGPTISICPSIETGGGCACPLPAANLSYPGTTLDLSSCDVPQGRYLTVSATLVPRICSANGGSNPLAKPVLQSLNVGETCPGG